MARAISVSSWTAITLVDCPARWPHTTYPEYQRSNLRLLDYTITVNVDPSHLKSTKRKRHDRVAAKKEENIAAHGDEEAKKILPSYRQTVRSCHARVRVWDKTRDGLNAQAGQSERDQLDNAAH
jgi:hypothetical protein